MSDAQKIPQSSELNGGPGFRIRREFKRPSTDIIDRYRRLDIALVSDLMNRLYTLRTGLRAITSIGDGPLVGPACTVKVYPGDNLMVHASLDVAQPGDIIVIDTAGATTSAVIGDMLANKAKSRGIAGFIVDGLVRDTAGMAEVEIPVIARGVTPRGPLHRGPGELNYPVSCGGVSISPGDLMMATEDGVVSVPSDSIVTLLERVEQKTVKEEAYVDAVKRGDFSNQWVTDILNDHGCVFE